MSDASYADMANFMDFAVYLEVSAFSNVRFYLEGAPSKDDGLFTTLATYAPASTGLQTVEVVRWSGGVTPASRWLRWRTTDSGAAPWAITFRLLLNALEI
jgi:hypothetical protein